MIRADAMHRTVRLVLLALLASRPLYGQERALPTAPPSLPAVRLNDQFGATTDLGALRGRALVVIVSGRDGADGQRRWLPALRSAVPTGTRVLAVADLVGAPRLLRGVIRGGLPKDTAARVLLDWDGRVARPLRGEREHLVAAVYGADGALRLHVALPPEAVSPEVRERIVQALIP